MNTTDKKVTLRVTGNTTMVGVNVSELRRAYGATEASRICVSCDAPFFPHMATTDVCIRCEQRQNDRLAGAKLSAWIMAAIIFTLLALASRMHGASVVDDVLLNKVAWTESRGNPRAVGKLGEIGMFQLRPIAIREVNRIHGTSYKVADAWDPIKARRIAGLYLGICESRCNVKTAANVYAKYRGLR